MAQVDYFLKIDDIEGESTDDKHKGEIEIESFSWGVTNQGALGSGGGGAGKASFQDIHFTTHFHKASPILELACATGKHFMKAVLTCRKAGTDQQDFYIVEFADLLVSSYQSAGSGGEIPLDEVSLNYHKVEFSHIPTR